MEKWKNGNPKYKFSSIFFCVLILLLTAGCFQTNAQAQTDDPPADAAPPPMKIMTKDERKQLESEDNVKKRTQLSLDMMEIRLKGAEDFAAQSKFQDSINELGGFQALLENILDLLKRNDRQGGKVDNNFKRLEIGLRRTVPRLELVRRELPFKYGFYVSRLQKTVREARAEAVEPLFSDSVIRDNKP